MYVFVHTQGIKTVHAGGGSKNGKILSTLLLNAPPLDLFYTHIFQESSARWSPTDIGKWYVGAV